MLKIKKICTWLILVALIVNFFVPLEIQAETKNEANNFVDKFTNAVNNSDKYEIEECLNNSEAKIIDMFKNCSNDSYIQKYPQAMAYWYIAEGSNKIGRLNKSYNYYTKSINMFKNIENADAFMSELYRERAMCVFEMRGSNDLNDSNVRKAFEDIQQAYNFNSDDWITIYYRGLMNIEVGETEIGLNQLMAAQSMCPSIDGQNRIQNMINEVRGPEPGIVDTAVEYVTDNWDLLKEAFKLGWKFGEWLDNN